MFKKTFSFFCAAVMCVSLLCIPSYSADLSFGMNILKSRITLTKTVISGQNAEFSAEDFARAAGCETVEKITVVSVPDSSDGILRFGTLTVFPGQMISAKGLSALKYEPLSDSGQFTYKLNDDDHETVCKIYRLSEGKVAPTAKSMRLSTVKNIAVFDSIRSDSGSDEDAYEILSQPKRGIISVSADGKFKYTPSSGYTGVDSFVYRIVDKYGNASESATVSLKIERPDTDIIYTDMADHYAACAAIRLAEKNILIGEQLGEQTVFCPDKEVSRLEFLVMAMKAGNYSTDLYAQNKTAFADDDKIPDVQKCYVVTACMMDVLDDSKGVSFQPDKPITYGEAAMILTKLLEIKNESVSVFFPNRFTSYDAVQALSDNGFKIYTDPEASDVMSRADTALLLEKLLIR